MLYVLPGLYRDVICIVRVTGMLCVLPGRTVMLYVL